MELAARATTEGMANRGPSYMNVFMIPKEKSTLLCVSTEHFQRSAIHEVLLLCSAVACIRVVLSLS